jgi:hypothetical protein
VRFEGANLLFDRNVGFGIQGYRSKIFGDRRFLEGIEILAGIGQ